MGQLVFMHATCWHRLFDAKKWFTISTQIISTYHCFLVNLRCTDGLFCNRKTHWSRCGCQSNDGHDDVEPNDGHDDGGFRPELLMSVGP